MSLVGKVGRRRFRARLAMFVLYGILCLGALTTLYPFALMISTGFKGATDQNDNRLIPEFWSNFDKKDDKGKLADGSLLAKYLADKYAGDVSMIASTRTGREANAETLKQYDAFLMQLPITHWSAGFRTGPQQATGRLTMLYQAWLRQRYPDIDTLNKTYVEENSAFQSVAVPSELLERKQWKPIPGKKYLEWLEFKASLPAEYRIPIRAQRMFQEFLRSKTKNQFASVEANLKGNATKFEELAMPESGPELEEFKKTWLPPNFANGTTESVWAQFSGSDLSLPIEAAERNYLADNAGAMRSEMTTRNYRYVMDYILLNGRSLWNTAFFCLLAILTQLTVNPLAAYALSRYPIRASGKILIFLLATMAFPAEVAMIPSFLLLKDLGLLNTFAALVLPGAASGYMIFLLKGFFDSLPQELYESGQLDGAKETTMMWKIALPLSKPVLGYLALLAFMGAYGAFLYAFLVAQDQRMWTLMVWIYQLQNVAPKSVMMAALTLAAIPTLLVFLFSQRVIMRGIVLPGER